MTHMSLFSGIGGLDLAAEWAGFETVGQCEFADYPYKVLQKHWPDVHKWRDIRTLTGDDFYENTGLHTVDVVSGGFPCQPFSVAGKRKGEDDDRYLWPEMLRVIKEIKPIWIIGENVPNIINMGIENCISQLENIGYEGGVLAYTADAVGAPFIGERIFIIAASNSKRWNCVEKIAEVRPTIEHQKMFDSWQARQNDLQMDMEGFFTGESGGIKRNDDGISEGMDRLKCVGNSVNPFHGYPIFAAIAKIEQGIVRATEESYDQR